MDRLEEAEKCIAQYNPSDFGVGIREAIRLIITELRQLRRENLIHHGKLK